MKNYQWIRVRRDSVPDSIFNAVCHVWPEGKKSDRWGDEFNFECWLEDKERAVLGDRILSICQEAGLSRSMQGGPGTYGLDVDRIYEQSDYDSAEFLLLRRQREIQLDHERDDNGRLLLVASKAKTSIKLGRIFPNWIIVSDRVKRSLETEKFKGLEFGEVVLKGKSIHAAREPFWELKSSVVLPRIANRHQFVHPGMSTPEPFTGDYSKMIMLHDPPFRTGEVHYQKSDIDLLLPFDIARTFENFMEPHPALIISQRFYQFCLKNKIPVNVQPVRIDPN